MEDICFKTERDTLYDEGRSDAAFDYSRDIKYEPLPIKQEPAEIAELEDASVQVDNIFVPKAEENFYIHIEDIGNGLSVAGQKCDICGNRCFNGLDLVAHRYSHTEDTYYTCCICNCNTFHLKPDLHRHMLNVHFNLTPKLPISAKYNAPNPSNTAERPYQCDICQKRFRRNYDMTAHTLIHTCEKPYECDVCHRRFRAISDFNKHMRIHTGEKPFECEICQKRFAQTSSLNIHRRVHTGEKPYACGICNKRFASNRQLTIHNRIHSGEKPFECSICYKRFASKACLTLHNRTHSGEKPFECDICNKRFTSKASRTLHSRIHSGEKPYKCDLCQKQFTHSSSLTIHKRSHTG